jgi:uncharacterized membrane protein
MSKAMELKENVKETLEHGLNEVLTRNIRTLLDKRRSEEKKANVQQRAVEAITRFCGSMAFVYFNGLFFGAWLFFNLGWFGVRPFDPSFVMLATIASVEAIFLSTFILISQNRMGSIAERRADLDLQISLLAEHEITQSLQLVCLIAERLGIQEGTSAEVSELKRHVAPERVLDHIERETEARN